MRTLHNHWRKILGILSTSGIAVALLVGGITPAYSTATSDVGTPTADAASKLTKLTYPGGTEVTMSYTGVDASVVPSALPSGAIMDVEPRSTYWGGAGDVSTAFYPATLAGGTGLVIGWNSFRDRTILGCLPSTDSANPQRPDWTQYPNTPNPYVCSIPATVTFTFSRPMTDAVFNMHNLAGGWCNAKASFYSSWQLSSTRSPGLTAELISKVGNFQVSGGNTIRTIQPPGTGITDTVAHTDPDPATTETVCWYTEGGTNYTEVSSPLDIAPQGSGARANYYGAGSGAVRILGTYSSVSFDVALSRYTNTQRTTPYYWDDTLVEMVMVNWSVQPEPALANTGANASPMTWGVALGVSLLGLAIVVGLPRTGARRRRQGS